MEKAGKPLGNSPIELRHLHAFAMVMSERHFGRAAERLGITQPLLSMRIKALESFVGHSLLLRRPKIVPTPAGEVFMPFAVEAMQALEAGMSAATQAARGVTGRFSIALPSWMITTGMPEVVNSFKTAHPEVDVTLQSLRSSEQIEEVSRGRVHIGFLRNPQLAEELSTLPVLRDPWVLAVPAGDRRASLASVSFADIQDDTLMIPDQQALNLASELLAMVAAGGGAPARTQEFGIWLTALGLVAVGAGIAIVPASQTQLWDKGIAYLPIAEEPASIVCAFWRRDSEDVLLRSFLQQLRERVESAF